MASRQIDEQRIQRLNDGESREDGSYVLYWMQQSQRAEFNHALEFAIQRANRADRPLVVAFGLTDNYPDANLRHYRFMLEGLSETAGALERRGIPLVARVGSPPDVALELAKQACEIVCDRGWLRHQREWRKNVARGAGCAVWQVETDAIVPVEAASDKAEFAARTIRPRLHRQLERFLQPLATTPIDHQSPPKLDGLDLSKPGQILEELSIDRSVSPVEEFQGGTSQARARLKRFLEAPLRAYTERAAILEENVSFLGPYLHFGQISPLKVALDVEAERRAGRTERDAFIEELLVRRELAINFVWYEPEYDNPQCLPDWAAKTLEKHRDDERETVYSEAELENAATHDKYWNAAMTEMRERGYLHNHLRMYWGKKIVEWSPTIKAAWSTALKLNNRYFLDGRDANSYMNVAWLFGMHDRAFGERPVFGKVRYMSDGGLRRKFDADGYVERVARQFGDEEPADE